MNFRNDKYLWFFNLILYIYTKIFFAKIHVSSLSNTKKRLYWNYQPLGNDQRQSAGLFQCFSQSAQNRSLYGYRGFG